MTGTSRLYVVIPVFNGWEQSEKCLNALRQSEYQDFQVLVVDHGSSDGTKDRLPRDFPEVTHLLADPELWWAGATNVGVEYALQREAEQIILLNNDCYVEPDCIGLLLEASAQLNGSVVAPVQKRLETGEVLSLAPTPLLWLGFSGRGGPVSITESMRRQKFLPAELIGGGRGVLVPAGVFENVGLFDSETLPHYHADHDFYLRCRQAGVPLYAVIDAVVHIEGGTTSMAERPELMTIKDFMTSLKSRRSHRNLTDLKAFFKKHYPVRRLYWLGLGLNFARYLLVYIVKRTRYLIIGHN